MKTKPPVAATLSWSQVHSLRLERHHLTDRAPKKDLARVVRDICGVQAQVMSAAELQVAIRVECSVEDVRKALWKDKALVKTWLMRGTLHLIPGSDLPLYTAATSRRWVRVNKAWLKFMQVTEKEVWEFVDAMGAALNGTPMTREQLIAVVAEDKPPRIRQALKSGWGGMLKPAARNGMLCFGPSAGQNVTFVRPEEWLGTWQEMDPEKALVEVARRYLRAYGPSTKEDFARWWGSWPGVGVAAWAGLEPEFVHVSVDGKRAQMLAQDLDSISKARATASVQLLPMFDPYLMGHVKKDHLYDAAYRSRVSRTSGWISAVVLVDGRVAGTWTHTAAKQILRIKVDPFQRLAARTVAEVRHRADSIAKTLGLSKAEVQVAG